MTCKRNRHIFRAIGILLFTSLICACGDGIWTEMTTSDEELNIPAGHLIIDPQSARLEGQGPVVIRHKGRYEVLANFDWPNSPRPSPTLRLEGDLIFSLNGVEVLRHGVDQTIGASNHARTLFFVSSQSLALRETLVLKVDLELSDPVLASTLNRMEIVVLYDHVRQD